MAVKQKVVECVDPPSEQHLELILRALQDITSQNGIHDKVVCANIVASLGTVQIPKDPESFIKFMLDIQYVQSILAKECSNHDLVFLTLKALYDEISDPTKELPPTMSIVLQLMDVNVIPKAVTYILNTGYPEQNLERALFTLCTWLTKWTVTDNLGPLVLAFMQGLEMEHHYDILVDVSLATIVKLFKMLILAGSRDRVGPVVFYMLTRMQHSPEVFHKIIPHVSDVVEQLNKENSESSHACLQEIVNICIALMVHFPGHNELYKNLNEMLQHYYPASDYMQTLACKSWSDGASSITLTRCSIGKVGLNNLGNTCYMNSVLQALFMTKTFRNEVLLYNKNMMPLLFNLQTLFALLQHSKRLSLSPNNILNLSRPPGFLPGHQHDSSEFLGYLLDTLHEQEDSGAASSGVQLNEGNNASALLSTMVQQSFGGKTMSVSRCGECGTQSERYDNFRELQLAFPNNSEQSIRTLLDYYCQPEKLSDDNQYHCDTCNRLTDGERITQIVELPPRLILTLKHFRYDPKSQQRTKLLQNVKLDHNIYLENVNYDLYAAVVHWGSSVDSGHYYTFARDAQDWYKFNDCQVIKTTFDNLCKLHPPETPYILFYCRQDYVDPENLPHQVLSSRLQTVLNQDLLDYESERRRPKKVYSVRQNQDPNNEPPPPGCGGGGFSNTNSNMFVC